MTLRTISRNWPLGPVSDEILADRLKRGDDTALAYLFERYQESLYRFLLRWLGSTEDAEDLVQETFIRVSSSIETYSSGRPFRPWIYTIAKHLAWKRLRGRKGEACVSMDDLPDGGARVPDDSVGPEVLFERRSEGEIIRNAVEGLPEDQRIVFLLHHYESLPYEEIAQICGCPIGTVKSRMHYALVYLRRRLSHLREDSR